MRRMECGDLKRDRRLERTDDDASGRILRSGERIANRKAYAGSNQGAGDLGKRCLDPEDSADTVLREHVVDPVA